jgi:hypothetical protein
MKFKVTYDAKQIIYNFSMLAIGFVIGLFLCYSPVDETKAQKQESISENIELILDGITALKTATYKMEINKPLLDRIDYLTRENVALLNEVGDLENQIREFGWLKK